MKGEGAVGGGPEASGNHRERRNMSAAEANQGTTGSPLLALPGAVEAGWPDESVAAHYGEPDARAARGAGVGRGGRPVQPRRAADHRPGPAGLAAQPDHAAPRGAGARSQRRGADAQPERAHRAPPDARRRRHRDVAARASRARPGRSRISSSRCDSCSGSRSPTSPGTTRCSPCSGPRPATSRPGSMRWRPG